ncbi:MAG: DUF4329 domain-containing protein [Pseudomonadota bacterium]
MSGYSTAEEAAIAALNLINPLSIKNNREYAGLIYRQPDGRYNYTQPRTQPGAWHQSNASLDGIKIPAGTVEVGNYHTHGDYTMPGHYDATLGRHLDRRRRPGERLYPQRTPFGTTMTQQEFFTDRDIATMNSRAQRNPEYRAYLGVPNGAIYALEPGGKTQTTLQLPTLITVARP